MLCGKFSYVILDKLIFNERLSFWYCISASPIMGDGATAQTKYSVPKTTNQIYVYIVDNVNILVVYFDWQYFFYV